ncbi:MAG: BrnT family toxin [bacterium]
MLDFEWNEKKAESNLIKHGIRFEDCVSVFDDKVGIYIFDEKHSIVESRFILIGNNNQESTMVISYTIRNNKIRIISCRTASKNERKRYEEKNKNN